MKRTGSLTSNTLEEIPVKNYAPVLADIISRRIQEAHEVNGGDDEDVISIGGELEFPVVDNVGNPKSTAELFTLMYARQWDTVSNAKMEGFFDSSRNSWIPEAGKGTLEMNVRYSYDIASFTENVNSGLKEVSPLLDATGTVILSYPCHPRRNYQTDRVSEFDITPRYSAIHNWLGDRLYATQHSMAAQCHCGIKNVEHFLFLMNSWPLDGLIMALTANSPVWENTAHDMLSIRPNIWQWFSPTYRLFFPRQFEDMNDLAGYYLDAYLPFYEEGDGVYCQTKNMTTFRSFLSERNITDEQEILKLFRGLMSTLWTSRRFNERFVTMEGRIADCIPMQGYIALSALYLGLALNACEVDKFVRSVSLSTWRNIAAKAHITPLQNNEAVLVKKMLDLAVRGLKRRRLGEEDALSWLYARIITNKNGILQIAPLALETKQRFQEEGLDGLLEQFHL